MAVMLVQPMEHKSAANHNNNSLLKMTASDHRILIKWRIARGLTFQTDNVI